MSKRNRTLLKRELDELPMEEMVMEAVAGLGFTHRCSDLFAGELPVIVIIAVGDAAAAWLEVSDNATRLAQLEGKGEADGPT